MIVHRRIRLPLSQLHPTHQCRAAELLQIRVRILIHHLKDVDFSNELALTSTVPYGIYSAQRIVEWTVFPLQHEDRNLMLNAIIATSFPPSRYLRLIRGVVDERSLKVQESSVGYLQKASCYTPNQPDGALQIHILNSASSSSWDAVSVSISFRSLPSMHIRIIVVHDCLYAASHSLFPIGP